MIVKDLGTSDFLLTEDIQVLYISESQLMTEYSFEKLEKMPRGILIVADRNTVTVEQFSRLQDQFAVNFGYTVLPIGNSLELPDFLYQLSVVESMSTSNNQFRQKSFEQNNEQYSNILLVIPGLGKLKIQKLINAFGTIHKIALSSVSDLVPVIGASSASQVYNFFNDRSIQ